MDKDAVKARFDTHWVEDKETGCWNWTGALIGRGYGQFQVRSASGRAKLDKYAHRWSWRLHRGDIAEGMVILHTCDNRCCVNPDHLQEGTHKDNSQDMKEKGRHLFGERNSTSKLDEETVLLIHQLSRLGHSQAKIAKRIGVAQMTVCRILRGERWNHVYQAVKAAWENR